MDMKGEYLIPASRATVWAALNDIELLKAAIPGCQSILKLSDTEIEATVVAKVGPVQASFKGLVTLSDLDPPRGYTIRGEGKGGAAGFAKGGAKVRLADDPGGTRLSYEVDAAVGGKLAQVGGRLISATAKKLADEFFSRFSGLAAAAEPVADPPVSGAASAPEAPAKENARPPSAKPVVSASRRSTTWWAAAVIFLAVILAGIYALYWN